MTAAQSERLKKKFLASFRMTGNITESCGAVGIGSRTTIYNWQEQDDAFAAAFREAEICATERLEAEARRRGVDGVRRLKFEKGQPILDPDTGAPYTELEYSDTLLIFLLKARNPGKYRERVQMQHADAEGKQLPVAAVEEFVRDALAGR